MINNQAEHVKKTGSTASFLLAQAEHLDELVAITHQLIGFVKNLAKTINILSYCFGSIVGYVFIVPFLSWIIDLFFQYKDVVSEHLISLILTIIGTTIGGVLSAIIVRKFSSKIDDIGEIQEKSV